MKEWRKNLVIALAESRDSNTITEALGLCFMDATKDFLYGDKVLVYDLDLLQDFEGRALESLVLKWKRIPVCGASPSYVIRILCNQWKNYLREEQRRKKRLENYKEHLAG